MGLRQRKDSPVMYHAVQNVLYHKVNKFQFHVQESGELVIRGVIFNILC